MKFRNKKTGEIGIGVKTNEYNRIAILGRMAGGGEIVIAGYNSLNELNEEWEDYEEPKEFWHISCEGKINRVPYNKYCYYQEKEIGNYFETKEQAEKAIEKLKALKRLERKGFRFKGVSDGFIGFWFPNPDDMFKNNETRADLDLLFGGEE